MKVWNSYGSEHSADLVMIGRFKDEGSAEKAMEAIDKITDLMTTADSDHTRAERFSEEALRLLQEWKVYDLAPYELEQFIYGVHPSLKGDRIEIRTNEPDLSAFMKLMVDHGARVEIWCSRDYPESAESGEMNE
jgi:hypothetical protein